MSCMLLVRSQAGNFCKLITNALSTVKENGSLLSPVFFFNLQCISFSTNPDILDDKYPRWSKMEFQFRMDGTETPVHQRSIVKLCSVNTVIFFGAGLRQDSFLWRYSQWEHYRLICLRLGDIHNPQRARRWL